MARVAGVQIEKDSKGRPAYVRINLKKYGKELQPFLTGVGAIPEDEFEKQWESGIRFDEAKKIMREKIKNWNK